MNIPEARKNYQEYKKIADENFEGLESEITDYVNALERIIKNLLESSDAEWYENNHGHDWRDAVDDALELNNW